MTLRYPWLLLLLLLVPLLVYLRSSWRRKAALRFSDGQALRKLPVSWAVHLYRVLPFIYGTGLAFFVLALSRPQQGLEESRVKTEVVDIVLLVDVSTSMRAEDLSTPTQRMNRLDASKKVLGRFIEDRPQDRLGLIAFAALPYTLSPLTLDHFWLTERLNQARTGMLEDGTAIGDAIGSAINRLRDSEAASKVVILLTDGVNTAGSLSPENAAQAAKALGIKVYTVGAGSDSGRTGAMGFAILRQVAQIDEETLRNIAEITGAEYFRATDFSSLQQVYSQIDEMERTEVEVERYKRYQERFMPFLIAALALLLLEKLASGGRLRRVPE